GPAEGVADGPWVDRARAEASRHRTTPAAAVLHRDRLGGAARDDDGAALRPREEIRPYSPGTRYRSGPGGRRAADVSIRGLGAARVIDEIGCAFARTGVVQPRLPSLLVL